ncbi:uncharacterized protein [Cicer arietinum]|uniref:Uncharacterized protein LOC101492972 n=1 Tax=Cicer arietinum TaxID=3827 RepID=A0A1S2Z729_CICAR|nr:uncharacterized protein LOC101492972 [Cicer arietinum]
MVRCEEDDGKNNEELTLEVFRNNFLDKYFPKSAMTEKEAIFLKLYQGNLTIAEYAAKFDPLAKGRYHQQHKSYARPQGNATDQPRPQHGEGEGTKTPCQNQAHPVRCFRCNREGHRITECLIRPRVCYICQKPDNFANEFPERKDDRVVNHNNITANVAHPTAKGRVYHINGEEALSSYELIQGKCFIAGKSLNVRYDSGATHSFISLDWVDLLQLVFTTFPFDLVVTLPSTESVKCNTACLQCSLVVFDMKFNVDLICIPLKHLGVIPGMD